MIDLLLSNFFLWTNIVIIIIFMFYQVVNNKEISLNEFFIQIFVTIAFLTTMTALFYLFGTDIYKTEVISTKVVEFKYNEPWTEEYDCSETVCTTNSKGENVCHEVHKTCTTRHSKSYYIIDSDNDSIIINERNFYNAKKQFGAREKHVHRYGQTTYSKLKGEGDVWVSKPNILIPVAKEHRYENYLLGSKETIQKNKGKIKYQVEKYPKITNNYYGRIYLDRVINFNQRDLEKKLNILNSKFGKIKQINILIYVTDKDKDFKDSLDIAWKGANKNDSVLILGVRNNKIIWSDSINWSENERFGIELERDFSGMSIFDTDKILNKYKSIILKYWKRKPMEETYGYLKTEIEIPWYLQLLLVLSNLILNYFLFRYFLKNKI